MSNTGTVARGIKTPIIKTGDDLKTIVVNSIIDTSKKDNIAIKDKDIIAITEAVCSIAKGNYATLDQIGLDLSSKVLGKHIGIVFPILSRNRFSNLLRAFARSMDKISILLSYPKDEVGNSILYEKDLKRLGINPYKYHFNEDYYKQEFIHFKHPFTNVNMYEYYKSVVESENCEVEFIFSNQVKDILVSTNEIIVCDIHTRFETKDELKKNGAKTILGLDDLMNESVNGSGFNKEFGLLGSNTATKESVKLFPELNDPIVYEIQEEIKRITGKTVEVMIYGDGAFKDPVGKIWELADPVVSPSFTKGLVGSPNEIKIKYISDDKYKNLYGEELKSAIINEIKNKSNISNDDSKLGTTPRRYVDLIGSLCDLVSGSGDKGTPVVWIQDYFKNYAE